MKERGGIGTQDPSPYDRPARSEAERLFNAMVADPRSSLGWPQAEALDG